MNHGRLIPELINAISIGYVHDFQLQVSGTLRCLTECSKPYFELNEVTLDCLPIASMPMALLFLIATNDGLLKGTLIHYPEDYS